MKQEKATKVFNCCGEYLAVDKSCTAKTFVCPRCGKKLTVPDKYPTILIVKK